MKEKFDRLSMEFIKKYPRSSAILTISNWQKTKYLILIVALVMLLIYRWDYFVFVVSGGFMLLYLVGSLQKLIIGFLGYWGGVEKVSESEMVALKDEDLPVYTILLPLFREERIADKIVKRISNLDYPKDKLDVKLLVEADDMATKNALQKNTLPPFFEIIEAPATLPQTKPRACNYGLEKARGEFCVIFDAEDMPDTNQLKKAVVVFNRNDANKLACIQAKLNYHNRKQNTLTRLFTIEYTTNFDLLLPGLSLIHAPLPLGGTSNHFRTSILKEIGPWDSFNVTEDCDLGMRIGNKKYHTLVLESTTMEEANSQIFNFIRQRSRWVKGFMQTHLVHSRNLGKLYKSMGVWGLINSYLTVGGSVLMMLSNPVCYLILLIYIGLLISGSLQGVSVVDQIIGPANVESISVTWKAWHLVYIGNGENPYWSTLSLIFGGISLILLLSNFLLILVSILGVIKRKYYDLIPYCFLLPAYWFLISLGAWKGAWQLIFNPFYWEKTNHGLDEDEA